MPMENRCPNRVCDDRMQKRPRSSHVLKPSTPEGGLMGIKKTKRDSSARLIWNGVQLDRGLLPSAVAGRIMKVEVENFLYFTRRTFVFEPFINFLIGLNGTGKSTLAKAIAVGLGSTTLGKQENKRMVLKDFIKGGARSAKIRIHINNQGSNAYKADLFGSAIIIERGINTKASESYVLRNVDGSHAKSGKKELQNALSQWKIQIENPVFFMDQEESKHFLLKNKPSDFYKFFYDASGLAGAAEGYGAAEDYQKLMEAELNSKNQELRQLGKEVEKWQQMRATAPDTKDFDAMSRQMKLWDAINLQDAIVEENKDLQDKLKRLAEKQKRLKVEEKILRISGMNGTSSSAVDEAELVQAGALLAEKQSTCKKINQKKRALKNKIRQLEVDLAALSKAFSRTEAVMAKVQQSVDDRSIRLAAHEDYHVRNEVVNLKRSLKDAEESRSAIHDCSLSAAKTEQEIAALMSDIEVAESDVFRLQSDLDAARSAVVSPNGSITPSFCVTDRLAADHGCIGPLGQFITYEDNGFSKPVQQAIAAYLPVFMAERKINSKLGHHIENMKRECQVSALVPPLAVIDLESTSENIVQSNERNHQSVTQNLEITDIRVDDFLLHATKLPKTVIMEDASRILELMDDDENTDLYKILDLKGTSYQTKGGYCIVTAPRKLPHMTVRMPQEKKNIVHDLEEKLSSIEMSREIMKAELLQKEADRSVVNQSQPRLDKLEDAISTLRAKIVSLDSINNDFARQTADAIRISALKNQATDIENKITMKEEQLGTAKAQLKQIEEHQTTISLETEDATQVLEHLQELSFRYHEHRNDNAQLIEEVNCLKKETVRIRATIERLQREYEVWAGELQEFNLDADTSVPERIYLETKTSLEKLSKDMVSLTTASDRYSAAQCADYVRQLEDRLTVAKGLLQKAGESVKVAAENTAERKKVMDIILNRWKQLVAEQCRSILLERHFKCEFVFDAQKEELKYCVWPNGSEFPGALDALSGGERAFAMVAFLVSCWDDRVPFRILDEFDCYMDMQHREEALKTLVQKACADDIQCILLSPLEVNLERIIDAAGPGNRDKIHRIRL